MVDKSLVRVNLHEGLSSYIRDNFPGHTHLELRPVDFFDEALRELNYDLIIAAAENADGIRWLARLISLQDRHPSLAVIVLADPLISHVLMHISAEDRADADRKLIIFKFDTDYGIVVEAARNLLR